MDVNLIATKQDIEQVLRRIDALEQKIEYSSSPKEEEATCFPKLLRLCEVMDMLNMSENTIKKKIAIGEITRIEIYSGNFRFPAEQFDRISAMLQPYK